MADFLLMLSGALFAMFISGIVNYKKSTWVGLTEEEVALICADCSLVTPSDFYFAQAIEQALKRKNT